jgi:hypothetical protein
MEGFKFQSRDKLAKRIGKSPKEERKEILEQAKETPEYLHARSEKIKERQGEEEVDNGLGVLVKRKTIYHGSGISGITKFNEAEEDTVGSGIYFTSDAKDAIGYARRRSRRAEDHKPIVYEANIENLKLLDLRKQENFEKILPGFADKLYERYEEHKAQNNNSLTGYGVVLMRILQAIDANKISINNLKTLTQQTGKYFSEYVQSLGFDGLVVMEGGEGDDVHNHDTYLIFDPEKVSINRESTIQFEQKQSIPALATHETSPVLQEEAARVLKEQWEKFWQLRFAKQGGEVSTESARDVSLLKDGTLLHNLRYDENALSKILQSGVLSGELGYGEKESRAEDAETHYCADFFVNRGDKSIAQFVEFAYGNEENTGALRKKRIEAYACPREQNDYVSVVVDPSKPELAELLQHSATGIDTSKLANFPVRFPYGAEKPDIAKRHLAVLVGIPANYISSLVVGGKLASDQEKLGKLKSLVASSGLDIKILDYKGEEI